MLTVTPGAPVRVAGARWIQPPGERVQLAQVDHVEMCSSSYPNCGMWPKLGQAEFATGELEKAVADIAEQLLALSDRLQVDADLAVNPDRFQEIEIIGTLDQVRIFETVGIVAQNLSDIILGVLTPPLGAYATPAATAVLSETDTRLKAIKQAMAEAQGQVELAAVVLPEAEAYRASYLETISDVIIAVEKLVVVAENGNVDVYEEDEKNGGNTLFAVAGIAAVVALMVAAA